MDVTPLACHERTFTLTMASNIIIFANFMKKVFFLLGLFAMTLVLTGCSQVGSSSPSADSISPPFQGNPVASPSVDEKLKSSETIVEGMAKDGMRDIEKLFPDLIIVKTVKANAPENIYGRTDEDWKYSPSSDVTVIVCKDLNTPAHLFKGKNLSQKELDTLKKDIKEMMEKEDMGKGMMDEKGEMENKEMKKQGSEGMKNNEQPFSYEDYSVARFTEVKGKKPFALFFHASWCSTCRRLEAMIKENINQLPKGAVILKADYDEETALKKEYGVRLQSTLVFFDGKGNKVGTEVNPSLEKIKELL